MKHNNTRENYNRGSEQGTEHRENRELNTHFLQQQVLKKELDTQTERKTRQQSNTEPPLEHTSDPPQRGVNRKTIAQDATHRVVSPGYGRLSGGIRIHGVDDCLPLPFLVDLPKAPTGLSV